jgi:hypothetical protein
MLEIIRHEFSRMSALVTAAKNLQKVGEFFTPFGKKKLNEFRHISQEFTSV